MEIREAVITGKPWDIAQTIIAKHAGANNLEINPSYHIPIEDARFEKIRLYMPGAMINIAEFYVFFEKDGKTPKHIVCEYHENRGIESLLKQLGVKL